MSFNQEEEQQYRKITLSRVHSTLGTLTQRIDERFPNSGLAKVSHELELVCAESTDKLSRIAQPNHWLRSLIALVIVLGIGLVCFSIYAVDLSSSHFKTSEIVSISETILNEVILIGAALFFLLTLEARLKRARALKSINELRALAHVIDMHQLTKDPTEIGEKIDTASSPERCMTPYQLNRYLDYCSELLSILGKLAAIFSQSLPETELVKAVNDVEDLTNSLSRKIWQKINILQLQYGRQLKEGKAPVDQSCIVQEPLDD
jgi:hypothetical protein